MDKDALVQITRQDKIAEKDFGPLVNAMYEQVWGRLFPPQILTHDLSNTVAGNVITPTGAPVPDCRSCGACCASFVCVDTAPDSTLPPEDCWEITRPKSDGGAYTVDRYIRRREEDFSCTALEGKIGERVGCRVYEDRPRMCRQFEAGSDRCHAVRRAYGIEPFLSLTEMLEAKRRLEEAAAARREDPERVDSVRIVEDTGSAKLGIRVFLKNGTEHLIRTFDPDEETWFESEFAGLTLTEAEKLVSGGRKNTTVV